MGFGSDRDEADQKAKDSRLGQAQAAAAMTMATSGFNN